MHQTNLKPKNHQGKHCPPYISYRFPIPDSRLPIPDSRFPIPDSRFPTSRKYLSASVI
ncbi:hypothetical protein [Moorena sp. SIO4A5]|uniref:hypothetical protein n=1 Tax=Moorena sp. SIO4A5 TaxID=2607838 RepID=UPI0013CA8313|nr:hypothetical protein [Moorena sp. SIO4A5]NEO24602.1 hypothetical protein [Moorena sp. SIO4A5]